MKKSVLLFSCIFLYSLIVKSQTTTYSVLNTAYDRSNGTYFSLGSIDNSWFYTKVEDLVVPNNPASVILYPNDPTYVVVNAGNNTFPGIIANRSINMAPNTTSLGLKLFTYRTYFTLPNLFSTSNRYSLLFKMSADDAVHDVKLNGTQKAQFLSSTYNNIPGINKPYMLNIPICDTDFVSGLNYIDVIVADAGGSVGYYAEVTLFQVANATSNLQMAVNSICNGTSSSAVASVTTNVSNPIYSYYWTNSNGVIVSQTNNTASATNTVSNLPNGTYTIQSQVNGSCNSISTQTLSINCVVTPTLPCLGTLTGTGMSICTQYSFNISPSQTITPFNYGSQGYVCNGTTQPDVSFNINGPLWRVNKFNWNFISTENGQISGYNNLGVLQTIPYVASNTITPLSYAGSFVQFAINGVAVGQPLNQTTFSLSLTPIVFGGNSYTYCATTNTSIAISPTLPASGGPWTYNWLPGNMSGSTVTVSPLSNTIYTVTANSPNNCSSTATIAVTVSCSTNSSSCTGSLLFDATHPAVDLPAGNQYYSGTNGGYTWECWFKLNQPFGTDMRPLISAVDGVLYEDQWFGFGWQGGWFNEPVTTLVFKVDGPNSTAPTGPNCAYTPPGGYVLGTWYHAAGVMDYTNQISKLFLNGVLVDSKPITTPPITRVIPSQLCLNWGGTPMSLFGNMDEVRIWERAVTNAEILANYNQCLTGNEQNLLLYYRCNQSSGASIFDATPNNNVGTFSNLPSWSTQEPVITGTACATSSNTLSVINSNSVICAGTTVTLSANGAPSYTWSTGSNNSSILVTPLVTTSYTVSSLLPVCSGITFSNSIITVSVNPTPTITSTTFSNTSCGLSNGSATITSIPSTNTYTWSSGLTSTTGTVNTLTAGNYSVTVYNGTCQTNTVVSILSSVPLQIVSNTITGSDCGVNNGSILVTDNLVSSSYSWTPNISSSNNLSNLSPGTYSLLITNGICTTNAAYIVPQLNGPSAINVIQSDAICESLSGAISVTSVSNGVGPYQFSFNNLGYSSVNTFSNLALGVYTITVKDFNGCIYSNTVVINKVSVTSTIDLTTNLPTCNTNDGSFVINNISGGTKPYSLSFNGLSYSTDTLFEELGSGNYVLVIKDSNLCETNLMLSMPFDKNDYTLYVPNSFTPNKDVVNDVWFVKGTCINSFNCLIFNRWGERIIELINLNETWDGTFKGKNVPDGVYVYLIEAETNNGTIYRNGHITVFR